MKRRGDNTISGGSQFRELRETFEILYHFIRIFSVHVTILEIVNNPRFNIELLEEFRTIFYTAHYFVGVSILKRVT